MQIEDCKLKSLGPVRGIRERRIARRFAIFNAQWSISNPPTTPPILLQAQRNLTRLRRVLKLKDSSQVRWRGCGAAAGLLLAAWLAAGAQTNLTQFVNPFIGTAPGGTNFGFGGNSGDVFPGAAFPRGMLQWSPDTPSNLPGGYYYPDTSIKGFSVRHFSGRGCNVYQDFAFMPYIGQVTVSPATSSSTYTAGFSHVSETAAPGYYSVMLNNGVQVSVTATRRTGLGAFVFPSTGSATLLINAGSSINGTTTNTAVTVVGNNEVQGYATAKIGCGSELYTVYLDAQFDHAFASFGTWNGGTVTAGSRSSTGAQVGAFLTFDATTNRTVYAKVGISFVGITNAVANLGAENPNWDFAGVQSAADAAWNTVLNKIVVSGGTAAQMQTFYTALYHCFFHPNVFNDVNGQYLGMDGQVHTVAAGRSQYENIPGWDMYRSATALGALLAPDEMSDIAQSLVNDAQQGGGGLPRWEQANRNSGGMVGDGPVIILPTAYALGATNFDTAAALAAMDRNAGQLGTASDGHSVRSGLNDYLVLGYVSGAAAVTLEYASADFALSQFAEATGDAGKHNTYLARSGNWRNLFHTATSYLQPRNVDGTWVANVTPSSQTGFVEGSAAQYNWLVPYNLRGLFDAMGGNGAAVSRLDNYFTQLDSGPGSPYAFMGNEPCEGDPWEYDYAGAPSKTQDTVRRIQTQLFLDTPGGLPGNDDAGALSSWYVFSALGIYPLIPGVGGFVLGSPLFTNATVNLENRGQITIQGINASPQNSYVQSLTINGTNTTQLWLPFETIRNGGALVFSLSNSPSGWGTGPADAPPSFDGVPPPAGLVYQTELLGVAASLGGTNRIITSSSLVGGQGTILDAVAVGNYITYVVPSVPAGAYDVRIGVKKLNTRGIWQLAIGQAGNFGGTAIDVGAPQDEYAPAEVYTEFDLGPWVAASTTDQWFQFQIVGKNPSSSGYTEAFDYIRLLPAPPVLGANLALNAEQLLLSWPAWATNYMLYSATNLVPPIQWSFVTGAPQASNGLFYLSLPVTNWPQQFFRLSGP